MGDGIIAHKSNLKSKKKMWTKIIKKECPLRGTLFREIFQYKLSFYPTKAWSR
jgi:hypothetical protein